LLSIYLIAPFIAGRPDRGGSSSGNLPLSVATIITIAFSATIALGKVPAQQAP
jgi:hypothetical protein